MKVSAAARLWVFSQNIEDKLYWPDHFEWDEWPAVEDIPLSPGRPPALAFSPSKATKTAFPSIHHLENLQVRGRILHYFANHELLALELMALTLLKFPSAPRSFLQGLLQTLHDEQKHLSFYLERMREYGVEFGSVPVNGFFWDHLAPAKTPMEYAGGMALTFEQANLDFSYYYQQAFEKIGDRQTAEALHQVFTDEIRHVAYGLHWFDRWRDPSSDRWSAYKDSLRFPLTPQRAKGKVFHQQARVDAGFDREFIEKLKVYSHSTGRVPRVFLFNPDCEDENSRFDKHYNRPKKIQQLADDLALLPAYLCHASDIVLLPELPSENFLLSLQAAGLPLPELLPSHEFFGKTGPRIFESFEPWGWTPSMEKFAARLSPLKTRRTINELSAKTWSCRLLKDYVTRSEEDFICPAEVIGQIVAGAAELREAIRRFTDNGYTELVLKAPYGASGRNFQRISHGRLPDNIENWAEKIIAKQNALIVEPWLAKEFDYSLQITVEDNGETRINGAARFLVDAAGRYQGAVLGGFYTRLTQEHKRFLNDSGRDIHRLKKHFEKLAEFVGRHAHQAGYVGAVGIDALVYRQADEQLKIKPIVETNCRWNMGRLVVELEKKLNLPGVGLWQVIPYDSDRLTAIQKNFKPLVKENFERKEYYYLIAAHSLHQKMKAVLLWGPELNEIARRALLEHH